MYVHERMSINVATVKPEFPVSKAFQIMTDRKHSQLPVVDDNNKLVGLVTEKLLAEVNPSKATSLSVYEINYLLSKTKVQDIMKTGIFKVHKDKLIEDAALIMKENLIGSLPVVDDDDNLVGILTRVDIFKAFIEIMGVKEPGVRIAIQVEDSVGKIFEISKLIAKKNINIKHISNFNNKGNSEIIIKTEMANTDELIEEFTANGYDVISVTTQV